LGSTVLMGLLALPAEAKPPADNPNAGQPLKPSDGAVINGRLDQIEATLGSMTGTGDCTACHDDTTRISAKHAQWSVSGHGSGVAFLYGGPRKECAGCHSGGAFVEERVEKGTAVPDVPGDPSPSRQDCRTCHQIHVTYTPADWALETTKQVVLYAVSGATFDKGKGNLCASCHQPREEYPGGDGGTVTGISTHWGPHHGPQSGMMLGVAGAGDVPEGPGSHYSTDNVVLADGCVSCHKPTLHTFEPDTSMCGNCHDADNPIGTDPDNPLDLAGYQEGVQLKLDAIGTELVSKGYLTTIESEGHPTCHVDERDPVTNNCSAPANIAVALWNWLYIAHEDKSLGVHNPGYTAGLLAESCSQLGITCL